MAVYSHDNYCQSQLINLFYNYSLHVFPCGNDIEYHMIFHHQVYGRTLILHL